MNTKTFTPKSTMKIYTCLCLLFLAGYLVAQNNTSALLPMPNQITSVKGKPFTVRSGKTAIYLSQPELQFTANTLQNILSDRMQVEIPLASESDRADIRLLIDPAMEGNEHYRIEITSKRITISGATVRAVYYGVMTMDQLLLGDVCATTQKKISPVYVDDAPRFSHRALMLDPARHFLPVNDVKFFIDQMAHYKYNILQLHLTDDQGWRVEIKKHPKLVGKDYYTQEQLAEIIQYAAQRNIEVIPELDIPGHTVAILAAYPELGCTHTDTLPKIVGKTTDLMLCANNQKVYSVYQDIIKEISSLFPSDYIHLGGDEAVIEKNWTQRTRCQAMMKELGYQKASQLMIPFFSRMLSFVQENNKTPMLWCELDNIYPPANDYLFPYPKNVTLVSWRGGLTPTCLELTRKHGNPLIMAPGEYAYLDYPQLKGDFPEFNNWGMPVTTLEKSYQFDPGYGVSAEDQAHIIGVMGTLWGEAIRDINRATYMAYPRAFALAEAGWTQMKHRNWESFKQRLYPNLTNMMKKGVSVRVPFEIVDRK